MEKCSTFFQCESQIFCESSKYLKLLRTFYLWEVSLFRLINYSIHPWADGEFLWLQCPRWGCPKNLGEQLN